MIVNKIGYSYNDLTLIPARISGIKSRSDVVPFGENGMLPIFTAPMSTIVNVDNLNVWSKHNIIPIVPRNIKLENRLEKIKLGYWVALSLDETIDLFIKNKFIGTAKICIDIANGHMSKLIDMCREIKKRYKDKVTIMTGNIANPETLYAYEKSGIDYVRCSIGGGAGCFVNGTKIKINDGLEKNIEDINIGDKVLTIDGSEQFVENIIHYKTNDKLIRINNEITSTQDHKFLVINKEDKDFVTEENILDYGYWVEARKLNKNKHLLVKR